MTCFYLWWRFNCYFGSFDNHETDPCVFH